MAVGSIRERNGRFYIRTRVQVIDPDTGEIRWQQVEKAAGKSRRQAEKTLRGLQTTVDEGSYVPSSMTVLELGRKWLREHVQPNLKPGAAANYKGTFYRHVAPSLGAVRVDDCKPQMVKALLGRKRAEGLSEETVAKIRRHMHAMFAFAQDAGLLTVNPASAPRKRGQKQRRRARGTALSPAQIARFLNECSPTVAVVLHGRARHRPAPRRDDRAAAGRRGPARARARCAAQHRRVRRPEESDEDEIADDEDRGGGEARTDPRWRSGGVGSGAQRTAVDTRDEAPVFATVERKRGRDGVVRPTGRPLSPRMVTRVFRRYADRAGLPKTIRLHDLRHTAITNAISQGEDIMLVAAFAGHAKTSTTVTSTPPAAEAGARGGAQDALGVRCRDARRTHGRRSP